MTRKLLGVAVASVLTIGIVPAHAGDAVEKQLQEYRQAAQMFGKTLKGELQAAMKSGGPTAAVEVCNERAPEIAADLSEETGFTLRRTSLKPRATEPTSWETAVLLDFEQQRAAGTAPADIEWHEVVEADDGKELRYMKAIGTEGVCLTCHGGNVDPDLLAKIEKLYPEDRATGFEEGDIRGAFSIHASLDN
ncbi:DUF3365 domain-containing protein [Guyparkeria sp.]|uniref:Tll0287-like domain-containing protein n=1 Tax=Guyparkeria sp. TaxID=2035736 RepID=UPI003970D62B